MEAWMDLAMVVHELGGALTPTRNSLQLLQAREGNDPEQERLLDVAHRGLERVESILQNVTTIAALDHSAAVLETVELQPILQRFVADHASATSERCIQMRLHVESDAREIPVEAFAFERAVANLLSNAIKFTGSNGRVSVIASRARGPVLPGRMMLLAGGFGFRPSFIQVQVSDTGIGISAETRRRLFQPFFRGEEAATIPGMGLGLSVAQRLARRMRGDLRAESPKSGATFILTLPADMRTLQLVERLDELRERLHAALTVQPLAVAVLRRRSGTDADAQQIEPVLREQLGNPDTHLAVLCESVAVIWTTSNVRPLASGLCNAVRQVMGPQADRDFEVALRRASQGAISDALLLQAAVRCRHSLDAIGRRKREVFHVENSRRGR